VPKIIFNYKICDKSPECGGIATCPTGALTFNEVSKKPVWSPELCIFCLRCTMPDACPVGAILFARDENDEKTILDTINSDSRSEEWLWLERYGVQPSTNSQLLTPQNFDQITKSTCLIDVWSEDSLDCRLHSALYADLLKDISPKLQVYKLDAKKHPELAKKLNVKIFPSLLFCHKNKIDLLISGHSTNSKQLTIPQS
jgi:NAD-dependent dihydropyrimidine dehydrogenase PreA subunit